MWLLLSVVAAAAAVLSFAALRDLALMCGFDETLAPLLPVVVDAGAAAGCLIWLTPSSADRPRVFARSLTFVLLASSVAGNAIVHGLSAYHLAPPWWLVVAVSGIAPAVLGAIVHLAVLVGRDVSMSDTKSQGGRPAGKEQGERTGAGSGALLPSSPSSPPKTTTGAAAPASVPVVPKPVSVAQGSDTSAEEKARELLAANPTIGRRALSQQSGLSEYLARKLLDDRPRNGHKVLEDA